ncbi:MAG: acyl-CoA dehydrogenase [Betaproteobacteria bacterium]|nr:acyl-CoA dehydrogenase [Betaproteobacteria bacterium]
MIERTLFSPEHHAFRDSFKRFMLAEIAPHHSRWEAQGFVEKTAWQKAGALGFLCMSLPKDLGGSDADKCYAIIQMEELSAAGFSGIGYGLHSEIVAPYIQHYGTAEQQAKYLPQMASGEMVGAIAMTEPSAGSDLQGIRTTARQLDDGSFVLNGSKTFITNGWHSDLVIVVAKTNPSAGAKGISLFLLEAGKSGFSKGKPLHKLGMKAQDTCELFFNDVHLPANALLGGDGYLNKGFICLMEQLPWERLQIAISAVAASQAAINWTLDYVKQRQVFGQAVAAFQNTRFKLADMQTKVQIAQVFVDKCTELLLHNQLDTATASMAKYWCTDLQCEVMDECVQLHGGNGYMWEYPITRAYADARVQRIYGGTNEIMKEVITRSMGLGNR